MFRKIPSRSIAILLLTAAASLALAQELPAPDGQGAAAPMQHHHAASGDSALPALPGQDAFAAIQEIVRILEADPATDWTKVNLEALRQHLIDMNEVTLHAAVVQRPVEGGFVAEVTGSGRTLEAIRRMVPAQARELAKLPDWHIEVEPLSDGVQLTARTDNPAEVTQLRGLGFIGLLVTGSHHQAHHLALARGETMP